MARFNVQWAEAAVRDMQEIISYISVDSAINAQKLLSKLKIKAKTLESAPLRGRVVPELSQFGIQNWRELIVKPYRIIYRVAKKMVFVVAVFDGRRDLEDILLERLIRSI